MGAKIKLGWWASLSLPILQGFLYVRDEYVKRECYTGLQVLNWGISFLTKAEPSANAWNPHSSSSLSPYTLTTSQLSVVPFLPFPDTSCLIHQHIHSLPDWGFHRSLSNLLSHLYQLGFSFSLVECLSFPNFPWYIFMDWPNVSHLQTGGWLWENPHLYMWGTLDKQYKGIKHEVKTSTQQVFYMHAAF